MAVYLFQDFMRSIARVGNLFILTSYFILSAAPFIPLLFGRSVSDSATILGIEFVVWLAIWTAFKRPAWFHWLLIPAFAALPVEVYLQIFFSQGISTHHLGIIAETSPKESLEFLGNKIWLLLFVVIAIAAWCILIWRAACRTRDLDWSGRSRWFVLCLLLIGTIVWIYGHEIGINKSISASVASKSAKSTSVSSSADVDEDDEPESASESAWLKDKVALPNLPKLPSWAAIRFNQESFGKTWPFGLVIRGIDFWTERTYLSELKFKSSTFRFGAKQAGPSDDAQIVVMVIGESSRYDRWSLNGYSRVTNPLLKNESNLVSLSNVVTAVSATRLSVPVLVSRKPPMQSLKAGFSEKSFISAYKEAGFKTYWLSNQMSFGQFDTPISVFANEADVAQFLNLGGFTNSSSYDDILLDPLKSAIADPAKKKLIVLHSLGNHWNYSHRYPKSYDKWQPSLFGMVNPPYTDLKLKPEINNSYDNSILYTDWFLSEVIGALKSSSQLSSMMYVADHGQTLYDGTCNLAFHGHNTQFEFHVPALVWYSDQYKVRYPSKVEQLIRHKRAKLATQNVFHSLLDMADIRYDTEMLEWSFLSRKFLQHKRYVDSYGWTDYDNSTFKGDCREVIDNGKPLKQEK